MKSKQALKCDCKYYCMTVYKIKLILVFLCYATSLISQTLSGVVESSSGEKLAGAALYKADTTLGVVTNEYGFFSVRLGPGEHTVISSYVGFASDTLRIVMQKDSFVRVTLRRTALLEEVAVSASRIYGQPLGEVVTIPVEELKNVPVLGGEPDVIKSLALQPGISIGQEGTSRLYIRGGTPDQNLFMLDGVPIYNVTHLGGFMSILNPDAIKSIQVYKGDFPARYGGRASSVIDVTMNEGNKNSFNGLAAIGIINSRLTLQGPIQQDQSSYLFSGRASYLGLINLFRQKRKTDNYLDYWIYDVNGKVNVPLGDGQWYFSMYAGQDVGTSLIRESSTSGGRLLAQTTEENDIAWGNTILSTRYTNPIRKNMFLKVLLGYSRYQYENAVQRAEERFVQQDTITIQNTFANTTSIKDALIRIGIDHNIGDNHLLKYGAGLTRHQFAVGSKLGVDHAQNRYYPSWETYIFLEDDVRWSRYFTTNIGVRWSAFSTQGTTYQRLEPRMSLTYRPLERWAFHASATRMQQFIHLLPDNSFGFPNDIWVPATGDYPPVGAWQTSAGAEYGNDLWNASLTGYYKELTGLIDYQEGLDADQFQVLDWEDNTNGGGIGRAYGLEFGVNAQIGAFNGMIGYTLSVNERRFSALNRGDWYPFTYDRRHDFAISGHWEVSNNWRFSMNWVYQTGTAVTLPVGHIPLPNPGLTELVFAGRNNGRLPAYHRLDLGATYRKELSKGRVGIWRFSLYNAYNRRNTSYLFVGSNVLLDDDDQFITQTREVRQVTNFPILPGISYEVSF